MLVDETGVWRSLGGIAANNDWVALPLACTTPFASFRLNWNPTVASDRAIAERQTYYLRQLIYTGSKYLEHGKWIRIYPSEESQIIEIPYPPDLIGDPLPQRLIQVKLQTRRKIGYSTYALWRLEVFEKVNSNVAYPLATAVTVSEFYE